ncbi:MAG: MoaD/ThiS family protein [Trichodesmium sp. St15_bin1_1]|nr:MoaD/ThiS family protein [Trichodesmium sp. St16_bin2-tuft]MDE5112941.1 MoaD/ThiS family protein [Trichodesmium sp. St15_bin1_1]
MKNPNITITLKLFAAYQEAYKVPELQLSVSPGTTVSQLLDNIISQHSELEKWRHITKFGINLNFVPPETILQDGDEVVLIPPVSGGQYNEY